MQILLLPEKAFCDEKWQTLGYFECLGFVALDPTFDVPEASSGMELVLPEQSY